jgi:hypothetical protein
MTLFPLFTSIKPPTDADGVSWLCDCLVSWRRAGFAPIAVNGPREVLALRRLDLPVAFHELPHDGKPRIGAILDAIRAGGAPFAGIVNSDCRLIAYPDLAATLSACLGGRAVLAWRVDTGSGRDPVAEPDGLDGFFFDTIHLPRDDAGFTISAAFWDTWFPVVLAAAGAKVGKLEAPLMTHRRHKVAWDHADWLAGAQRGWTAFRGLPRELPAFRDIPASWWKKECLNKVQLVLLGQIITDWTCRERTDVRVLPEDLAEVELALRLGGGALATLGWALGQVAAIEDSVSWRITRPLRRAANAARVAKEAVGKLMARGPGSGSPARLSAPGRPRSRCR